MIHILKYISIKCTKIQNHCHTIIIVTLREVFIHNLKLYRKKNGIRQLDLAIEIGKSSNYINSIENGKYFPSPETIEKIAAILKIDPVKLFDSHESKDIDNCFSDDSLEKLEKMLNENILKNINNTFNLLKESNRF